MGRDTPWGEGDTPIKAVLQLLKQKKYNIPASIEGGVSRRRRGR